MSKRTKFLFSVVSIALLAFVAGTCQAAKMNLKAGHVLAPSHPYHLGLLKFSDLVSEKTNGEITIEVFHSGQLGNEREMIEGLQLGTLDVTVVATAPLAGFSKKFLVFDLPYIFKTPEVAFSTVDGPVGQEIMSDLEKKGIVGLAFWDNGFRHVSNSKLPLTKPEDMKGIKIRTMENKIHMASFSAIGADPTPMAFGELFTALQQKTVDASELPLAIFFTSNFFEVQEYLSLTGHFYSAAPLLISKGAWRKFTEEQKTAVQLAAEEARDYERNLLKEMDVDLKKDLSTRGVNIIEINKDEWAAAMSPVYKEFEKLIGADIIEKVREK